MLRYNMDGPTGHEAPYPELSRTKQRHVRWKNPLPPVGKYITNSTEKPQWGLLTILDNSSVATM